MIWKYLLIALVSMVPIVELRGAVPIGIGMGLHPIVTIVVCVVGNMLPVPIIHIFARKFLIWGSKQRFIGKKTKDLTHVSGLFVVVIISCL